MLDQLATVVEHAYTEHATARLEMELYEKQIELTRNLIAILEGSYATEGTGLDELLRYEQDLIDYQLKMLHAIVKGHHARHELQRLLY